MTQKDPRRENEAVLRLIDRLPTRKPYQVSKYPAITEGGNAVVMVTTPALHRKSIHELFRRAGAKIQYMESRGYQRYYVVYRAVTLPPIQRLMSKAA